MFDALSDEWRLGHVSDLLFEIVDRIDPNQAEMTDNPYVGLEHIGQGTGQLLGVGKLSDVVSQKSVFNSGDILYGKLRPNLRKVARPSFGGVCSTDIIVFRAKPGTDPDFVFQLLQSAPLVEHAIATAAGTKMPRTHAREILSFEIVLPPLDEQRRIAEVLRSAEEVISNTRVVFAQQRVLKEKLAESLFRAGVHKADSKETKIGRMPAQWRLLEFHQIAESITVGIASSATHAYRPYGIPLIRNQNIKAGHLDLSDLLFVSPEYDESYASKRVRVGDVITMRTGYPGKSAVVAQELAGCQTFTTLITRPNQSLILPRFLCEWINSDLGMREVGKQQAGGAQQNLNAGALKRLPVPVPPLEEQAEIAAVLDSFPFEDVAIKALLAAQETLRADLLTGRVRVPA